MEKEFIDEMKAALIAQQHEIMESLASHSEDIRNIMAQGETGDEADIASNVVDAAMLNARGTQDANLLQKIESALDRIKQGSYGKCLMCGNEIPEKRLRALPYAFLCIDCQSHEERMNR